MNKDLIDDKYGRFREMPIGLVDLGHEVAGLCLSYKSKPGGWVEDQGVKWRSINAGRLRVFGLMNYIYQSFKLLRSSDVVWACSDSFYGIIGNILGRVLNKPVVFDIYDNFDEFASAKVPAVTQMYHWAICKSDAITCLSESFKEYLEASYPGLPDVTAIEFAIDKSAFRPMDKEESRKKIGLPGEKVIIGTAGALLKIRDVPSLIEAFRPIQRMHPDAMLALAGPRDFDIPDEPGILDLGTLSYEQVPVFLNSLDVAVICYGDDNFGKYCFPQRTREYMACDVPIVAANVGSLREIFSEEPAWLYQPGDVDSLVSVLENRLEDGRTSYAPLPDWKDLATKLDDAITRVATKSGVA